MVMREKMKDGSTRLVSGLTLSDIMLALWPVHSIYISVDNTNPGTIFGGTWTAWGSGRVPVGVDTGQTEFDTVEETGGEKTHLLTAAESGLPAHTHTGLKVGSVDISWLASTAGGTSHSSIAQGAGSGVTISANAAANAASAHNNLQPYITCYMWKRTA